MGEANCRIHYFTYIGLLAHKHVFPVIKTTVKSVSHQVFRKQWRNISADINVEDIQYVARMSEIASTFSNVKITCSNIRHV